MQHESAGQPSQADESRRRTGGYALDTVGEGDKAYYGSGRHTRRSMTRAVLFGSSVIRLLRRFAPAHTVAIGELDPGASRAR